MIRLAAFAREEGKILNWVIAFVLASGLGLAALIGIGCAVNANACPFSDAPTQTSTDPEALWVTNCASCHGLEGTGGRGPNLVAGPASEHGYGELQAKISRGKPLAGMPAFKRSLTPEQIAAVARWVLTLRGEEPPSPAPTPTEEGSP